MALVTWTANNILTAAQLTSAFDNNGYTQVNATVANVTLGTGGTAIWRYSQLGKTVFAEFILTFGTGSPAFTGAFVVNVPNSLNIKNPVKYEATGAYFNGNTYPSIFTDNGANQFAGYAISASGALAVWVNFQGNVTVASGNTLTFKVTYETV